MFLQTAPDRDSGSDRQRIHRGESVNKLLWSFAGAGECPNPRKVARGALFPLGYFSLTSWLSRYEGKAFPGLLVCQNAEAALQTAPDRDSGSDRQRIHRGESVNKFLWSFA